MLVPPADVGTSVERSATTILGVVEFRPSPSEDWLVNIRRIRNVASRAATEVCGKWQKSLQSFHAEILS